MSTPRPNGGTSSNAAGAGGGASAATSSGTGGATSGAGGPAVDLCTACGSPAATGAIVSAEIDEASGLAASLSFPNVLYVHNDSGDSPRFFATDLDGTDLGSFAVGGASATDWEDMARGPCGDQSCLFLGDIGDNPETRASYTVYRVPEPAALGPGPHMTTGEALPFHYPDGSHNAETLLVHPVTGAITLVTKVSSGASSIYELPVPLTPGVEVVAVKKGEVAPPAGTALFTGGDVHPQGKGVLLRTYTHLFYYPGEAGESVAAMLAHTPCAVPVALEMQGEAVAWLANGTGYVTASEGGSPDLDAVACE